LVQCIQSALEVGPVVCAGLLPKPAWVTDATITPPLFNTH
jgi:hypothetical protein